MDDDARHFVLILAPRPTEAIFVVLMFDLRPHRLPGAAVVGASAFACRLAVPILTFACLTGVAACSDDDETDPPIQCPAGQEFSQTENRCVDVAPTDADNDGVVAADDCDDTDDALGARSADADCDGVLTADDCDDMDAGAGSSAEDMDCDGVATADDCDDTDTTIGSSANDMDCDGVATADDCDDTDAMSLARAADADCDGVPTADDCDDDDENVGAVALDADCDGTVNENDECPNDPSFVVSPPPTVVSTFPTAAATTNSPALNFSGVVQLFCDNALASITARIDGNTIPVATETTEDGQTRYRFSSGLIEDTTNAITIEATDSSTKTGSAMVSVAQATAPTPLSLASSQGITIDAATNIAYVADEALPGVYSVNLATQEYRIVSGAGVGAGDPFSADLEGGIDFDIANNRILVTDDGADAVIAVDPTTGDRTIVSGQTVGAGTALSSPFGIATDGVNNVAYVVDTTLDGVLTVNLATGDRAVLSSDGIRGAGVDITSPRDVDIDAANNRLLVVDTNVEAVVAVDLTTGDRTIVSDVDVGMGPELPTPRGITLDSANNRALVAESGAGFEAVIAVDLTTGDRTELSGLMVGAGPTFDSTRGILVDAANSRLVVVDDQITNLVAVDLASGDRTLIEPSSPPPPGVGAGPALESPVGVVYDPSKEVLYVADDGPNAIVSVNLASGDRSVIADSNSGGTTLLQPRGLGFDVANNRLLVPDNNSTIDGIVGISLETGEGTIVSGDDSPDEMSESFASPRGRVAIEPGGMTALVADTSRDSLFRFDLMTGERTTVVEGGDRELEGIQSVAVDATNARALVTVASTGDADVLDGIVAVDLTTGSTTTLANRSTDAPAVGSGIDMTNPRGIVLDEANNRALVFDADLDALISVDLDTLDRTVVANENVGNGDHLGVVGNNANFIELDAGNQRVFAVSEIVGAGGADRSCER